jgi:hypothetical protein
MSLRLALQAGGKILVGGSFASFAPNGGCRSRGIARLNPDGTADSLPVRERSLSAVQSDGMILASGEFGQ